MVCIRQGWRIDGLDLDLDQARCSGSGRDGELRIWMTQGQGIDGLDLVLDQAQWSGSGRVGEGWFGSGRDRD